MTSPAGSGLHFPLLASHLSGIVGRSHIHKLHPAISRIAQSLWPRFCSTWSSKQLHRTLGLDSAMAQALERLQGLEQDAQAAQRMAAWEDLAAAAANDAGALPPGPHKPSSCSFALLKRAAPFAKCCHSVSTLPSATKDAQHQTWPAGRCLLGAAAGCWDFSIELLPHQCYRLCGRARS